MADIHYVECNMSHSDSFVVDVPEGYQWLLVITKTPAQFWVDGELKVYPAHSVVLYRPSQKVYYRACTEQFVNDWIRFETDEPYITESPLPTGVPFALIDPEYCRKMFELLVIEHNNNRDYKKSSIDLLLRALFNKLLESYFHDALTPQYYNLLRLRTAVQHNPAAGWSVSSMASFLQISPGYLQNLYKKTFGISCMDDVISNRIRMAQEYLLHNAQSIAEVASRCGYQNVEHFCRQFKQVTGHTPRSFQKNKKTNIL
ncbi:helix-turn-helix domain-containing protein [Paenibacillus kobensis]|uniref:helix-turn-helix domain-containing protein n=1 Tax=Paenibacillus kobensis TaxID=59841 RepID=UPI000FDC5B53|nr:AraC family transcriptional regulator [Paenibacillus kobensis]